MPTYVARSELPTDAHEVVARSISEASCRFLVVEAISG